MHIFGIQTEPSWSPSFSPSEGIPTRNTIEPPQEAPADTLRDTLLRSVQQITRPSFPSPQIDSIETLRSALILRCCFHISQGLADQPLDQISLLPPFLPEKIIDSASALECLSTWTPLPQASPAFCDPYLLLLSSAPGVEDLRFYLSYLSPLIDVTGNSFDAFIHEVHARHGVSDGNGRRYYCLYDNCVYNMMPVAVSQEGFEKHLKGYHGISRECCRL